MLQKRMLILAAVILLIAISVPAQKVVEKKRLGPIQRDVWLVRLDSTGNVLWQTRFGHKESNFLKAVELPDGELFLTGFSDSCKGVSPSNRIYRRTLYRIGENGDTSGTILLGDFSPALMTALDENGNWFGAQYAPEFKFFRYDRRQGKMQEWPLPSVERGHFRYIDFLQSGYLLEGNIETRQVPAGTIMPSIPPPKAARPKVDVVE